MGEESLCTRSNCYQRWIEYEPLQEGGMIVVRQCPDCAHIARQQYEQRDRERNHGA